VNAIEEQESSKNVEPPAVVSEYSVSRLQIPEVPYCMACFTLRWQ